MVVRIDQPLANADWIKRPEEDAIEAAKALMRGEKHTPGGVDHDQEDHGNWADTVGTTATVERPKAKLYVSTSPHVRQAISADVADEREDIVRREVSRWPGEMISEVKVAPNGSLGGGSHIAQTHYVDNGKSVVTLTPHIFNSEVMGRPERESTAWVIAHEMAHAWSWRAYSQEQPGYADLARSRPRAVGTWLESWVPKAAYEEMKGISDYGRDNGIIEAFAEAVGMYVATGRVPGPNTAALFRETFRDTFYPMEDDDGTTAATKTAEADRGVPDAGGGARTGGGIPAAFLAEARGIIRGLKFNPNHEPAGSPKGGQFASAPGGSGDEWPEKQRVYGMPADWTPQIEYDSTTILHEDGARMQDEVRDALLQWSPSARGKIAKVVIGDIAEELPDAHFIHFGGEQGIRGMLGLTVTASRSDADPISIIYLRPAVFDGEDRANFIEGLGSSGRPELAEHMNTRWVLHHEIAHVWQQRNDPGRTQTTRLLGERGIKEMEGISSYGRSSEGEAFAEALALYATTGRLPGHDSASGLRQLGVLDAVRPEIAEDSGEKHYPGGHDHDQEEHGNWADGDTTVETVPPQEWHDDWRREFIKMMKGFGATDEMAEKFAGDVVILPSSAVRLREPGRQVYVVDRTGSASDEDMRRVGRYAMEAMRRDPQEHLSRGRDKAHLQISIVDTISVKDGPGVLGASGYHGQDIEFKPRALTLARGNKGEWMPAADEGDILRYLVAHEYGHIRATETYGMQKAAILPKFARASKYARTSPHEAYAEGYAQWVIDKSVVPELAKVAKAEGWPGAD